MQTLGGKIKKARLDKSLSYKDVFNNIFVPIDYLKAFEQNDYSNFKHYDTAVIYLESYCNFLHLDTKKFLAYFRRDYPNAKNTKDLLVPKKFSIKTLITPISIIFSFFTITLFIFSIYAFLQYKSYHKEIQITVLNPTSGQVVSQDSVLLKGKVQNVYRLYINNEPTVFLQSGEFEKQIILDEGLKDIEIRAENFLEQQKSVTITLLNNNRIEIIDK